MQRKTGQIESSTVASETVDAFVPFSLPPEVGLDPNHRWKQLLEVAETELRVLELAGDLVPSIEWFVYAFVRKEAVLSAQIEGTQATLVDLLEVEATGNVADDDVEEVCGYIDALNFAWSEMTSDQGLPISMRLLSQTHKRLLAGSRGETKNPGEVRKSQNWIGGTRPGNARFVPPPPHRLDQLLGDLERFIHASDDLPPLVKIAFVHVQFETIHPYLDGNGRMGRLLVALLLKEYGLLSKPMLYLSLFLKQHRSEYYSLLDRVRFEGDWERWVAFFLEGIAAVAKEAAETARRLHIMIVDYRQRLLQRDDVTVLALRLFETLPEHPVLTVNRVVDLLSCSRPAAAKAIGILESTGIVSAKDDRKKNRTVTFDAYLEDLRQGTDL